MESASAVHNSPRHMSHDGARFCLCCLWARPTWRGHPLRPLCAASYEHNFSRSRQVCVLRRYWKGQIRSEQPPCRPAKLRFPAKGPWPRNALRIPCQIDEAQEAGQKEPCSRRSGCRAHDSVGGRLSPDRNGAAGGLLVSNSRSYVQRVACCF